MQYARRTSPYIPKRASYLYDSIYLKVFLHVPRSLSNASVGLAPFILPVRLSCRWVSRLVPFSIILPICPSFLPSSPPSIRWIAVGCSVFTVVLHLPLLPAFPLCPFPRSRRPSPPFAPNSTRRVSIPLICGSSPTASAAHEAPATFCFDHCGQRLQLVKSTDDIARSGSRSRKDSRYSRVEAATTCPSTKA